MTAGLPTLRALLLGVKIVPSNRAIDEQNRLILRLAPRHNKQTPRDAVPF